MCGPAKYTICARTGTATLRYIDARGREHIKVHTYNGRVADDADTSLGAAGQSQWRNRAHDWRGATMPGGVNAK